MTHLLLRKCAPATAHVEAERSRRFKTKQWLALVLSNIGFKTGDGELDEMVDDPKSFVHELVEQYNPNDPRLLRVLKARVR